MNIRKVNKAEAQRAHEILLENGRWMLANGIEQWPMEWLESIENEIFESVSLGNFWCCDIGTEICAVVEVKREAEALWGFDTQKAAYIHKLTISRSKTKKGLGGLLLDHTMAYARDDELHYLRLDCVASNKRLRDYYERRGFKFVRTENNGQVDLALFEKPV